MTAHSSLAPRWHLPRPRFSLRTLLLCVLFVGACGGLWWRWEPWVVDQLLLHGSFLNSAWVSQDGRRIVTANGITAKVWDAESGRELASLEHQGWLEYAIFSPDGRYVASVEREGRVSLWSWEEGARIQVFPFKNVSYFAVSPDGKKFAAASQNGSACLWDVASGQVRRLLYVFCGPHHTWTKTSFVAGGRVLTLWPGNHPCAFLWSRRRPEYWWGIAWLPEFWLAYFSGGALLVIAARNLRRQEGSGGRMEEGGMQSDATSLPPSS